MPISIGTAHRPLFEKTPNSLEGFWVDPFPAARNLERHRPVRSCCRERPKPVEGAPAVATPDESNEVSLS